MSNEYCKLLHQLKCEVMVLKRKIEPYDVDHRWRNEIAVKLDSLQFEIDWELERADAAAKHKP